VDESQGVPLATIQELVRYWSTDYNWRKVEARLNVLPHFITELDGPDFHFIHVRSKHENALPVIVTHGWPRLDHRAAEDYRSTYESYCTWRERIGCFPRGARAGTSTCMGRDEETGCQVEPRN
jgi:Epoxide hydrolase N terminus